MRQSVSVCLATYNGEKYVAEQIESILVQLRSEDELIVSDDGSTDNTKKIISGIKDDRIKFINNSGEHGYTPNFENALLHSTKEVIFLSDQDDIWERDKLLKCLNSLEKYDFVVHNATIVDSSKNEIGASFFRERKSHRSWLGNLLKFSYLGCCMAFRRQILDRALPFPLNHRFCTHDNWLFLIAKTFYNVGYIDTPLIKYRRHGNNTSTGGLKRKIDPVFMVKYRIYLLFNLLKRK